MKTSQKLYILLSASFIAITTSTAATARPNVSDITGGNVSDITGGNVSDITGGNVSDVTGGNVSDITGGNVSDRAGLNKLAEDLGTAYESCQGGAGCSSFYELYEQTLNILD